MGKHVTPSMSLFVRHARSLLQHKFVVHPVTRLGSVNTAAPARAFATGQRSDASLDKLASRVLNGERAALSKAITLIESANLKHRRDAARLMSRLGPPTLRSFRIAISGPPGAGKSTFIESFGKLLTESGHRLAVLAIDPSSVRNGGSILGDKTRMPELSVNPDAYIRPSPSRGEAGGIVRRTFESVGLCEAGGYDVVLVETVGVGQGELAAERISDMFVLLHPPGSGDEMQGIKRGVMEQADLVIVTKCDGHLGQAARHAVGDLRRALQLHRPKHKFWKSKVQGHTARPQDETEEQHSTKATWGEISTKATWETMCDFKQASQETGAWRHRRMEQLEAWLLNEIRCGATDRLDRKIRGKLDQLVPDLYAGVSSPREAVEDILDDFCGEEK